MHRAEKQRDKAAKRLARRLASKTTGAPEADADHPDDVQPREQNSELLP